MEQNETFTQTKKLIFLTISYKMSRLKQLSTMTLNLHNKNNFTCSDVLNTHQSITELILMQDAPVLNQYLRIIETNSQISTYIVQYLSQLPLKKFQILTMQNFNCTLTLFLNLFKYIHFFFLNFGKKIKIITSHLNSRFKSRQMCLWLS